MPRSRSSAAAFSRSPFVSSSVLLTSIMPAPVSARSSLMLSMLTAIVGPPRSGTGTCRPVPKVYGCSGLGVVRGRLVFGRLRSGLRSGFRGGFLVGLLGGSGGRGGGRGTGHVAGRGRLDLGLDGVGRVRLGLVGGSGGGRGGRSRRGGGRGGRSAGGGGRLDRPLGRRHRRGERLALLDVERLQRLLRRLALGAAADLDDGVRETGRHELDRADRIVVPGNDVVQDVGIAVRVG